VQKILDNPGIQAGLREFLTREIEGLYRLTDQVMNRAMKKKPKRVPVEEEKVLAASV
jgi:hypothetical protein